MNIKTNIIRCKWNNNQKQIECLLPITLPTSKVRVKRRGIEPIAPRQTIISYEDFIEWQISYKDEEGRPIELGEILYVAYEKKVISKNNICSIMESYRDATTFEKKFRISRETESQNSTFYGFKVIYEKTPILRSDLKDGCFVELVLKHKQKAIGYQTMIYIYIPMKNVIPNLIGRKAKQKEKVIWIPKREHILELLKAFFLASETHREDIKNLFMRIVKGCP